MDFVPGRVGAEVTLIARTGSAAGVHQTCHDKRIHYVVIGSLQLGGRIIIVVPGLFRQPALFCQVHITAVWCVDMRQYKSSSSGPYVWIASENSLL